MDAFKICQVCHGFWWNHGYCRKQFKIVILILIKYHENFQDNHVVCLIINVGSIIQIIK